MITENELSEKFFDEKIPPDEFALAAEEFIEQNLSDLLDQYPSEQITNTTTIVIHE